MEVGLGPGHIILDGDPASLAKKGNKLQFSDHVCCGQMAGWIKMPFGTEVDLAPGDIVTDGKPARRKGDRAQHPPPQFWPNCCGQTAAWTKVPLGTDGGLGPGHIVLHEDHSPLKRGTPPHPSFSARVLLPNVGRSRYGPKIGGCAPLGEGNGSPSNTKSPGLI